MLEVFTECGIPNKIRCDRGSNFTSLDFASFCSDLGISLSFSSSNHHQSVPAECSVKTVKKIMKKCHETGTPWRLGLLEYLCTPLDEKTPSPSSLLSRQFKGLCPIFSHTNSGEGVLENLINRRLNEKLHHDRRSCTLEDIPTGSTAAVLDHRSNTWTVGHILDRTDRIYTVELPTGRGIHEIELILDLHLWSSNAYLNPILLFQTMLRGHRTLILLIQTHRQNPPVLKSQLLSQLCLKQL